MLQPLMQPKSKVKLLHAFDKPNIRAINKKFINVCSVKQDYIKDLNFPKVSLSSDDVSSYKYINSDSLNMTVPEGQKYKIEYSTYDNYSYGNYSLKNALCSRVKEYYGTANGNCIRLEDENVSLEILITSPTYATIMAQKQNEHCLIITKIYLISDIPSPTTIKLTKDTCLLRPIEKQFTFNTSNLDKNITCYYIHYADGLWVACTYKGFYYSIDGKTWEQGLFNADIRNKTLTMYHCHYADGLWVACSTSDGLWYSSDGLIWEQSNITDTCFYRCDYSDQRGIWVACGEALYYSEDGKTWTECTLNDRDNTIGAVFQDCHYANGIWVATALYFGKLYYSTDGKTWTCGTVELDSSMGYCYFANGIWIGYGYRSSMYYSQDGCNWSLGMYVPAYHCHYADGIWVACTNNKGLYYSTDGMTWTKSNITDKSFYHCHYIENMWITYGETGLYYSYDGKTWTQSNITTNIGERSQYCTYNKGILVGLNYYIDIDTKVKKSNITDIKILCCYYAKGVWVACTHKGLYYSTDGKTWRESNITDGYFNSCHYADGIWVAVAKNGGGFYYSYDGIYWVNSIASVSGNYCIYSNNLWIVCSWDGLIYSSPDGKTWTESIIPNSELIEYCHYADGLWVACTWKGLYYSTDGKTWRESNITDGYFYRCDYANGVWVACGSLGASGVICYSEDGKTWTECNITAKNRDGYYSYCHYADGVWVAYGYRISYSIDNGRTWISCTTAINGTNSGVCYFNGVFITYGPSNLHYSRDGIHWDSIPMEDISTRYTIYTSHYANGVLVLGDYSKGLYYLETTTIPGYKEVY